MKRFKAPWSHSPRADQIKNANSAILGEYFRRRTQVPGEDSQVRITLTSILLSLASPRCLVPTPGNGGGGGGLSEPPSPISRTAQNMKFKFGTLIVLFI